MAIFATQPLIGSTMRFHFFENVLPNAFRGFSFLVFVSDGNSFKSRQIPGSMIARNLERLSTSD